MLAPTIDDAHLIDVRDLRRLRLLFEDFPKNHNLVLVAQPELLTKLALSPNEDLRNRVTYSLLVPKLAPDDHEGLVRGELDRAGCRTRASRPRRSRSSYARPKACSAASATSTSARSSSAVRDGVKHVDLKQVNRVLLLPHSRERRDQLD